MPPTPNDSPRQLLPPLIRRVELGRLAFSLLRSALRGWAAALARVPSAPARDLAQLRLVEAAVEQLEGQYAVLAGCEASLVDGEVLYRHVMRGACPCGRRHDGG